MTLDQIKGFYPPVLTENPLHQKYLVKEYLLLLILDFLSTTSYIRKIAFIGGTNLRLVKGIDRFSEDIELDCKNLSGEEFMEMTDAVLVFLQRSGWQVETRDRPNEKLKAFRRSFYFPELLYKMGLSRHRDERFLIKIGAEDQKFIYQPVMANIRGCGMLFPFPVPDDRILCAMKVSAMLTRSKGRDFYDCQFLLGLTQPDYSFLTARLGIRDAPELNRAIAETLKSVDLTKKVRDFEHLLFNRANSRKILLTDGYNTIAPMGLK